MKARTYPLVALLLMGVASSPLWAQGRQNQPAQPQPPADEVVQKFLDAPVWYLSWRISLVARGSGANEAGDPWSASLQRVTNGSAQVGIRSQGPSLSMLNVDPTRMQAQAFLDMIPKYANWMAGPHITEDMTPQEQDAAWTRVMEQNQKAHGRYHFSSQSSGGGGPSHTRMGGSAPVIDLADYHLEIDAVSKKYKFKLSSGFADSEESTTAIVGETVTNIGTEGEHHLAIETSMHAGASEEFVSINPELGLIEGDLPGAFGNLSGSPSHAVVVRAFGHELRGTLMIQFSISPTPPEPAELVIIPPDKYADWRPTAAEDEKTRGDFVPVKVKLQKPGGGDPQYKADRFVYRLKSSKERGVCMNWPPAPEADSPFDFQFEQEINPDYDIIGMDRQIAEQFVGGATEGEVNVSCFDYGAYGELEVLAELENGQVVYGAVQGTQSDRALKLPLRADDSLIAQAFLKNLPNPKDDDDDEIDPVGDAFPGDGLSLYEEYRGFKVGDFWTHADPEKKDVFVLNQMRGMPEVIAGIKVFEKATGLKVHYELNDNQVNAVMMINFWATTGPHVVDQHVIRIQRGMTRAEARAAGEDYAAFVEEVGTPGSAKSVHMPPDMQLFQQFGRRRVPYFAYTLAHEMLHSCNVFHHGEADEPAKWVYIANPAPHIVERSAAGDTPITLKREDGSVIDPRRLFSDPANVPELDVPIGVTHGQHSGHEGCLMRYDNAFAYIPNADPNARYVVDEAVRGTICTSPAGTGVNAPGRAPQSRYGPAATAANGGPDVALDRGNCRHQIRVNDKGQEPER